MDYPMPDAGNFNIGEAPVPDNFLDDTLQKAMTEHKRQESQIQSVHDDLTKVLDPNVASNIATNLIGYMHDGSDPQTTSGGPPIDPDENGARQPDEPKSEEKGYQIDDMLVEAVTQHKRKESRQDFVETKLHEMFPQDEDDDDGLLRGAGQTPGNGAAGDMSLIASNLVAFLHDDGEDTAAGPAPTKQKARGSTDLSDLQNEIEALKSKSNKLETGLAQTRQGNTELTRRVQQLEDTNQLLMKEIEHLQHSKTRLAMSTTKCIDELRAMLIQYQSAVSPKK